mmetsp:Transcript_67788/g.107455  ORF Transcript_67788/g.107455 Transcript_67788/m.107455 type:complete len:486 (-) Transcript_67788:44-1501(-)
MGKHNAGKGKKGARVVATDDGSIEVMVLADGWTPAVIFKSGGQSSFVRRAENNVAWMLQTLLDSGNKVDTLYDHCRNDHRTMEAVKSQLGVYSDISIVEIRGRSQRWQNVKAVGVNGKRSHIFALIVALGMTGGYNKMFKQELEKYGLAKGLLGLLERIEGVQKELGVNLGDSSWDEKEDAQPRSWKTNYREEVNRTPPQRRQEPKAKANARPVRRSPSRQSAWSSRRSPSRGEQRRNQRAPSKGSGRRVSEERSKREAPRAVDGIAIGMVCKSVPVITLQKSSPFTHERLSWLLSTAMAQERSPDYLLEQCNDTRAHPFLEKVQRACEIDLNLQTHEISIVKVADLPLTEVLGVGTSGRQSSILAAIVAIALRDEGQLEDIRDFFRDSHRELERPFYDLIKRAVSLKSVCLDDDLNDNNGDLSAEATWDPYMAAEEDLWNRPSARDRQLSRHHDGKKRILNHLDLGGRDRRRRMMSRSRSGRRR